MTDESEWINDRIRGIGGVESFGSSSSLVHTGQPRLTLHSNTLTQRWSKSATKTSKIESDDLISQIRAISPRQKKP
jgi:hypothetical protein